MLSAATANELLALVPFVHAAVVLLPSLRARLQALWRVISFSFLFGSLRSSNCVLRS